MNQIKIAALGGLGEDGKNLYMVENEQSIFLFDCGLKYPSTELFGVESIIPDYTYLINNKEKIKGIFISHAHEDHIGGLPRLLSLINIPIYASKFTNTVIKDRLKLDGQQIDDYQFYDVSPKKDFSFGTVKAAFFYVTHSIPGAIGIALYTKQGAIVYTADYNFDQNVAENFKTDFSKLAQIASNDVLALLGESIGSSNTGYTHNSSALDYNIEQVFQKSQKRVIATLFSTDLLRIQKVIDIALKYNRRIAIIGRKSQRLVDLSIKEGYLNIPENRLATLKFIDEKNKNNDDDLAVIITGIRHEPFYMLQRMINELDRLIHLEKSDTVMLLTPPIPGTEAIASRTLDELYKFDCNIQKIHKSLLPKAHASSEDIKLLTNILRPKYIFPVIGEFRHQYAHRKVLNSIGYGEEYVPLLENGQVAVFKEGFLESTSDYIYVDDVYVDGILDGDLSDVVIRDRELLAQDGFLMLIANIDSQNKKIIGDVEIVSKGFMYMKENSDISLELIETFMKVAETALSGRYIDWRKLREQSRKEIINYLWKKHRRQPIIIPVLIDTKKEM
jgi:ribonuclease J